VGVDHSVRLALCKELPRAAATVAAPSDATFPTATLKVTVVFPPATVTLAGTLIALDGELKLTIAFEAAGCASSTVHEVVAPDITPFGLQLRPVTPGWTFIPFARAAVHVVDALDPTLAGVHTTDETSTEDAKLTVVLAELPL